MKTESNKEKGATGWRIVLLASTVAILLLLVIITIRGRFRNPLKGEWMSKSGAYKVDVKDEKADVEFTFKDVPVRVGINYEIDRKSKTVTVRPDSGAYDKASKDSGGVFTPDELNEEIGPMMTEFDYSLEDDILTLTEREYGDSYVFEKVR